MVKQILLTSFLLLISLPALACSEGDSGTTTCAGDKSVTIQIDIADQCQDLIADLEAFLVSQPNACHADDECEGYYFRAAPHSSPVVLNKAVVTPLFEQELMKHQADARRACVNEWATQPASPTPFRAACINNACVDLMTE